MAVHLSNQYISQISVGDSIEITKIHTENLRTPAVAEVRYITKEKINVNDVKQIFYKVALFIKKSFLQKRSSRSLNSQTKKSVKFLNKHRT